MMQSATNATIASITFLFMVLLIKGAGGMDDTPGQAPRPKVKHQKNLQAEVGEPLYYCHTKQEGKKYSCGDDKQPEFNVLHFSSILITFSKLFKILHSSLISCAFLSESCGGGVSLPGVSSVVGVSPLDVSTPISTFCI